MQRYLINHLSAGEFIALLMAVILFTALSITYISRRYLSNFINYDNNVFTGYFLTGILTNYGFLLGFIIVSLWQELYAVKTYITQEGENLSLLLYNMDVFPQSLQAQITEGVRQYIKVILDEERSLMRWGQVSENAVPSLQNLFHIIQSYSPETKVEEIFYKQFVENLNHVVEFRRKRLEYVDSSLTDSIRFMLFFGIMVILFLVSLLESRSPRLKILDVVLVSGIFSFNLGLALLLDYPLAGSLSASPAPLTKGVLERLTLEDNQEKERLNPSSKNVP